MPSGSTIKTLLYEKALTVLAGGEEIVIDLPGDYAVKGFGIRVSGSITVGTADATGVMEGGSANFFDRIFVDMQGAQSTDVKGADLRIVNLVESQSSQTQTDPALTQGDKTFACELTRDFYTPRVLPFYAERFLLPTHLFRNTKLRLTVATPDKILCKNTATTLVYKSDVVVSVWVEQAIPSINDVNWYLIDSMSVSEYIADFLATGVKQFNQSTGFFYRRLIVRCNDQANITTARAASDTIITKMTLSNMNTFVHQTYWKNLQHWDRANLLLTSAPSGYAAFSFDKSYTPGEFLDTRQTTIGNSDVPLELTCNAAGTDPRIRIIAQRIKDNIVKPLIQPVIA